MRDISPEAFSAMIAAANRSADLEGQLCAALAEEERIYRERCEPIVEQLARILSMKPMAPVILEQVYAAALLEPKKP